MYCKQEKENRNNYKNNSQSIISLPEKKTRKNPKSSSKVQSREVKKEYCIYLLTLKKLTCDNNL